MGVPLVVAGLASAGLGVGAAGGQPPGRPPAAEDLSGFVMEGHGDVFDEARMVPGFHIHARDGRTLQLDGVDERTARSLVGRQVRVRGTVKGNRVAVDPGAIAVDGTAGGGATGGTTALATAVPAGTPRSVAVLLVKFADAPVESWTADTVRSVYFDGATSANAFFQDDSNGAISLTGDVLGYYQIVRSGGANCDWSTWGTLADQEATRAGVNLAQYQHVSYVFSGNTGCSWGGLGYMPGTRTYIRSLTSYVVAHELGHNFGVHHAATIACRDAAGNPVPVSSTCTLSEYGDPFSTMGNAYRLMHGFHRLQMGWLTGVQTATTAATFTIVPVDSSEGTRLVRIPRGDGTFLDVDFRQPTGLFDTFATTAPVVNGVTLRINSGTTSRVQSRLVDVTPTATASFSDSALRAGQSFTDPVSNATVAVQSVTTGGAVVNVSFGPDTVAPSAPTGLRATVSGSSVALTWTASTDNRGVASYRVVRGGTELGRPTAPSYTDAAATPGTTVTYTVTALDAAGNESAPASLAVTVPTADTAAPTAPTGLTASVSRNRTVTLRWTASSDDRGVVRYDISRSGRAFSSTTTSATDRPAVGTWTYTVVAVDAAGNRSPGTSVTVIVR